tara:strand:+ start:207 stop:578 length:372 start_codon:yes stop_codon:yes gene_type:complete
MYSIFGEFFWLLNIHWLFFYMLYMQNSIKGLPYQKPENQLIYFLKVLVLKVFKSLLTNIFWYLLFYVPHILYFIEKPPSDIMFEDFLGLEISYLTFFVTTYILTLILPLTMDLNLRKKFNSES